MIDIRWNPTHRELRIFSALLIVFFAFIAALIVRRTEAGSVAGIVFGIALIAGTIGIIFPAAIRPVYLVWMLAGFPIGWLISHAILLMIYWFVFTPIGLLLRWSGRDPMQRKLDRSANSYWEARQADRAPKDYFRQF